MDYAFDHEYCDNDWIGEILVTVKIIMRGKALMMMMVIEVIGQPAEACRCCFAAVNRDFISFCFQVLKLSETTLSC